MTQTSLRHSVQLSYKGRVPRRVLFWLIYTFQWNLHWIQLKQLCHLNLGNLMGVQERHITNRKCRDSVQQAQG
ncbi:hypothetical protein J6590_059531 [Homalodisca vitripennis]|nr:hypothetical protein J6590_059531 [Homalodisca vitripennis]